MDAICPHCSCSVRLSSVVLSSKERLQSVQCQDCGSVFDARAQMALETKAPTIANIPPAPAVRSAAAPSAGAKPVSKSVGTASSKPASGTSAARETVPSSSKLTETSPGRSKKMPAFIGNYQVVEEINRGGMGIVYKAIDPELKRKVAIKVLLAGEGATATDVMRFRREAQATARLQHPNIVPIYAVGEYDGKPYFVMDFIEGRTAKQLKDRGEMTPRLALKITEGVADALHHAHLNGVFHRDVKPANIIVGEDERAQLMDFGLARRADEDLEITQSGTTMGTPSYMSPEQAEGHLDEIDAQSDVYSAGACLYELLTGRVPFDGATTLAVLRKIIDEPPQPPRKLNPAINRDIETICLKCLEKKKASRFASALELANDIRRFNAGEAIAAKPLGVIGSLWRQLRRHKEIAIAALVMVISGIGALGYAVYEARSVAQAQRADRYSKYAAALDEGNKLLGEARAAIGNFSAEQPSGFERAASRARALMTQAEDHFHKAEALYPENPEAKAALETLQRAEIEADIRRFVFKAKLFLHPPAARPGDPPPTPNYGAAEFAAQEAVDRDPKNAEAHALLREALGMRIVSFDNGTPAASATAAGAVCEVYARKILDSLGRPLPGDSGDLGKHLGTLPVKNAELEPGFYVVSFVRGNWPRQQAPLLVTREAHDTELTLALPLDAKDENMALIAAGETKDAAGKTVRVLAFAIDRYEYPNKPGVEPMPGAALLEAQNLCDKEGKKLCTIAQWQRACSGDGSRRFPYGNDYISGACATGFDGNAQTQPLPSGHFPRCRTPEGVYDMAGNAAEWAEGNGENLLGGDWTASLKTPDLSSSCRTNVPAEEVNKERRGFRCCKAVK